jgi:glycosyltransferase involved in cell wall biosynthesis
MKVSVLINNYNYQNYVLEAIASALKQTVPPDEIIVVDDGSKDNSAQILRENYGDHPVVKLILKEQNEGHLSCFNAGFLASTGDIIFFLDSDDLYKPNYIEEAVKFYEKHPECDFLFCDFERIGQGEGTRSDYKYDRDFGYSAIATLYRNRWVGSITTTLSIRRKILEKILPVPFLKDWINGAENCLVYGSSIVGAHKFYCAQALVQYRLHGKNDHYTRKGRVDKARRDRLFSLFTKKTNYPEDFYKQADTEFQTIPKPLYKEFRLYLNVIKQSSIPAVEKLKIMLSISLHFLSKGDFLSNVPDWHL